MCPGPDVEISLCGKKTIRSILDTTVAWSLLVQVSFLSGLSLGVEFDLKEKRCLVLFQIHQDLFELILEYK